MSGLLSGKRLEAGNKIQRSTKGSELLERGDVPVADINMWMK
jgi:hypothetical protein